MVASSEVKFLILLFRNFYVKIRNFAFAKILQFVYIESFSERTKLIYFFIIT